MSSKKEMYDEDVNTQSGLPPYNMATAPQGGLYPSTQLMPTNPPVQQQPQVVIVQTAQVFGPRPQKATCPSCNNTLISKVRVEASAKTHLIAVILCLTTCCCCLPYCIDSCQSTNHHCSNCGAYMGTYGQ